MLEVNGSIDAKVNHNVYVLFGWEAVQARPNLDPYTSTLRMNDETQQVYTSDVHIKHHVRRGMKRFAQSGEHPKFSKYAKLNNHAVIFYEKEDEEEPGATFTFDKRLEELRKAHGINKKAPKDALHYCLDTPLFGYVHAVPKEHFNVTNAANTLFRPATFHACQILPLGRNNAFPSKEGAESSGSATVDSLEYGFFLSLWEINLSMLRVNASGHEVVSWEDKDGYKPWLDLLVNGLWRAYTTDRYPSFTQRSQFGQFLIGWQPEPDGHEFISPQDLIGGVGIEPITGHEAAMDQLKQHLPEFLNEWGCTSETEFVRNTATNFTASLSS